MTPIYPGEFEQMVLLAILQLEGDAYALSVIRELDKSAGRRVSRGALYKTLERLEDKGFVLNVDQAIDRVVRSILSWEACEKAAEELDTNALMKELAARKTASAEDMMRHAVVSAQKHFDDMYGGCENDLNCITSIV